MNKTQAIRRVGQLEVAVQSLTIKPAPEQEYVLMVEVEYGEPLFWNNEHWWVPDFEIAQTYLNNTGSRIFYGKDYDSRYETVEQAELIYLNYRLKNGLIDYEKNERGNVIERHFYSDYDGCHGSGFIYEKYVKSIQPEGWRHYGTRQDSEYYRIWYNVQLLTTVSYCEGDITIVRCTDIDSFMEEVIDLQEFQFGLGYGLEEINFIKLREELEGLHAEHKI